MEQPSPITDIIDRYCNSILQKLQYDQPIVVDSVKKDIKFLCEVWIIAHRFISAWANDYTSPALDAIYLEWKYLQGNIDG